MAEFPPIVIPEHVLTCHQMMRVKARQQLLYPTGTPAGHEQYVRAWTRTIGPALKLAPPGAMLDIGCGLAIFDVLMARAHKRTEIYLLDALDDSPDELEYSGGDTLPWFSAWLARDVIKANVSKVEPTVVRQMVEIPDAQLSLIVSFRAMGWHFPVVPYASGLRRCARPGCVLIFDTPTLDVEVPVTLPGFTERTDLLWRTDKYCRRTFIRDGGATVTQS